ncbi:N-alpha-acetyltransferase 38-A, NatC auxiliary subunit [Drosophila guanche]|uniref:Blast:N-alpha-acetyltransferase 38, NatC auxiliary subunit n=1 Tax=Drosophila guanche TaxID=7266 RepID=A0A3B0JND8_DROGU|nr:N-alpha-acetyltransferase 38-A, NatC auxiliary subunit [Drosophila guanche]SPP82393.1 blast:N-alpha-acetyltransferase 38%2C NatC auxiliary subunit [Drosophila guanche]
MEDLCISGHQVQVQPVAPAEPFRITTNAPHQMNDPSMTAGRKTLQKWLGRVLRIVITDGRVLVGFFNCTDRDANIVLSMCAEYLVEGQEPRLLGNVMVPGKHIVSISIDEGEPTATNVEVA